MKTQLLSLNDKDLWGDYIKRLPIDQQDVYFTPEYYSLYENYGDGEALCFVYEEDENIALYPFLKNSINKLGYNLDDEYFDIQGAYGYNGMITSSKDENFIERFHIAFSHYCEDNNIVAEFTRFHPLLSNYQYASVNCKVLMDRKTVAVNTYMSIEDIWKNQIQVDNRNKIKKALKNNLEFIADFDFEYMNSFIRLYKMTMDKLSANYYYYFSENYFKEFELAYRNNGSFIGVVKHNDTVVSAALFMYKGIYGHYHLAGSNKDYLKMYPNNLLLFGAINKLKDNGVNIYHLGGGTTSSDDDSLLKFKSYFGKNINDFRIGKTIHNDTVYENIISQWKNKFPESYEKNKVKLLGYRDI